MYVGLVIILEGIILAVHTKRRKTSRDSLSEQSRCWRYFDKKYKSEDSKL